MRTVRLVLFGAVVLASACSNKLTGDLEVNGTTFTPESCRNGVVYGFRGVELTAKSGLRLRVAATQTGEGQVVVMPEGQEKGVSVGPCGTFSVSDQHSEINNIKNVEGKGDLACEEAGYKIRGSVTFANCH